MADRNLTIRFVGRDAGLSQTTTKAKQGLAELDKIGRTSGFTAFNKSIDDASNKLAPLQDRTRALGAANLQLAASLGTPVSKVQELNKAFGTLPDKTAAIASQYRALQSSGTSAAEAQSILAKQAGVNERQFKALQSALGGTKEQQKALEQQSRSLDVALGAVAATAGGIAVSIGAGAVNAVKTFVGFDNAIKQAGVVGGASAQELGGLRTEVERLGVVTSKTPKEVGETSVALSRAGFSAQETSAALEGVVRASEATGESLLLVGDISAKTIRTFGLAADESGMVADVLVSTANNTNTTVNSIGESLAYVGPVAAAANQSLTGTAIAIGLLGDSGIQGSAAGTGLAAAMEALKQASAGVDSEFSNLVRGNAKRVEAFELINTSVRNADGSMKDIVDILPDIKTALGGLSQQDQDIIFKALFGVQGGRTIQTLLNATDERIQEVTASIEGSEGAAVKAGEAMLQGLGGALDLIGGSIGAVSSKIGSFIAIGLEPLVRSAIAILNGFLALPAPIQAALAAVVGFAGAVAGAVALLTTLELLQVKITGALIAETAARIGNTASLAANSAAKGAALAITTAYTAMQGVFTASLTKENVLLVLNTAATRAAAMAKILFAGASGTAGAAALALAGKLAVVAAQSALAVGALYAVSQVFKQSEGAKYAKNLELASKELQKIRGQAEPAETVVDDLGDSFGKFFDNLRDKGPAEAIAAVFVDLGAALSGAKDSADRFGVGFGIITATQRGNQKAQLQTTEEIERYASTIDDTLGTLQQYGQAIAGVERELNAADASAFSEAAGERAKALQEEIDLLKDSKGQSDELDTQLDAEIAIRENLIESLRAKVEAQTGDTKAVDDGVQAGKKLGDLLTELKGKYDDLTLSVDTGAAKALAGIAQRQADGLISEDEAALERFNVSQKQLQDSVANNQKLLSDLQGQRTERKDNPEEAAELDRQILQVQQSIAKDQEKLATDRIARADTLADAEEKAADDREKSAKEAAAAIKESLEKEIAAIEAAATKAANVATEGEQQRQIELAKLRRDGVISEEQYQEQLTDAGRDRIKAELAAEQEKYAKLKATEGVSEEDRSASRQRINSLTLDLITSEIEAEEAATEVIEAEVEKRNEAIESRAAAAENAAKAEVLSLEQVATALEAINGAYDRQNQLLTARTNLLNTLGSALSSSFDNAATLLDQDIAGAKNEKERAKLTKERDNLEKQSAAARRASLERAQTLELLTFDLRQKQLQIENQIEQARIRGAIAENQAAQARAQANIATLQAEGGTPEQIRAAQLELQASRQGGEALSQQFAATLEQGGLIQELAGIERTALIAQQGSALRGADVAELDRRFQLLDARAENASGSRESRAIEQERQQLRAQNNQLQRATQQDIQFLGANETATFTQAVQGLEQFAQRIEGTGLVGGGANPALNPLQPLTPTPITPATPLPVTLPPEFAAMMQQMSAGAGSGGMSVVNDVQINITGADVANGGLAQNVEDQVFAGLSRVVARASNLL
jgi:TP901 family phage tail tape measure protein